MFVINAINVNDALVKGIRLLANQGEQISVRGMNTVELPCPAATVYERPWERVLFDPIRDANPYFHFMESLWILNGNRDVEFVSRFNKNIKRYSDDGIYFHGAYGWRLREFVFDQLRAAIDLIKRDPSTRRAVLQIWDAEYDLGTDSNDIPCNDLIFLKLRNGKLHMRVCCRSNDIIWGCYGANAVHFSYLLDYLAGMLGVKMGTYTQISDSYHAYTDNPQWDALQANMTEPHEYRHNYYPLIQDASTFDSELEIFMNETFDENIWFNSFFPEVAIPMYNSWYDHKQSKTGWVAAQNIKDTAWREACLNWLARRGDKP